MTVLEKDYMCTPRARLAFKVLIFGIILLASIAIGYAVTGMWCGC